MISIVGLIAAICGMTTRSRRATSRATLRDTATWMKVEPGPKTRTMDRCGIQRKGILAGPGIATVRGITLGRGAGAGLATSRGDLLRITMDAGRTSAAVGVGARGRIMRVRSMDLRSSVSSAEHILASVLGSAAESAGSPWGLANRFTRGITPPILTIA